jgi:hypothetical protein
MHIFKYPDESLHIQVFGNPLICKDTLLPVKLHQFYQSSQNKFFQIKFLMYCNF